MKNKKGISNLIMLSAGAIILFGIYFLMAKAPTAQIIPAGNAEFPVSGEIEQKGAGTFSGETSGTQTEITAEEPVMPVKESPFSLSGAWEAIFGESQTAPQAYENLKQTLIPDVVKPSPEYGFVKSGKLSVRSDGFWDLVYDGSLKKKLIFTDYSICYKSGVEIPCDDVEPYNRESVVVKGELGKDSNGYVLVSEFIE